MKLFFVALLTFLGFCFSSTTLHAQAPPAELKGKYFDGMFMVYASDYALAEDVGAKLRSIYQKVIDDTGYTGSLLAKYQILIWKDRAGFDNFLKNLKVNIAPETDALVLYNYSDTPTIAGYWSDSLFANNLPHEFTHLILVQLLKVEPENIPLWLNEGLAGYESSSSLQDVNNFLNNAIKKGDYIKLEELILLKAYPQDKLHSQLFYAQAHSFVGFLINKKPRKDVFYSFLNLYINQSYEFSKAYLYAYGEASSINELQEEWFASIAGQKEEVYGN
ncbi:MAG: peptidase MA family metallohydrolase [Candidatus Omnitrophica bacterium]|nr:peptidase MA family metallohydrolase [Candidatus Omnitrophota bacterium]